MRIVDQIIPLGRNRYKILFDDHTSFALYKKEVNLFDLKAEHEISDGVYDEIVDSVLMKRAKLRSLALLKNKSYTEKQLREKLQKGYYPQNVIDEAVQYVKSYRYIDDFSYARDYVEYHSSGKSRSRIEQDLLKKGIEKNVILEAFSAWMADGGVIDETGQILKLIQKKKFDLNTDDVNEKQKILRYLLYKGYKMDQILKVIHCSEYSDN